MLQYIDSYIHIDIHIYAYMCIHICIYLSLCLSSSLSIHLSQYIYIYIQIPRDICNKGDSYKWKKYIRIVRVLLSDGCQATTPQIG